MRARHHMLPPRRGCCRVPVGPTVPEFFECDSTALLVVHLLRRGVIRVRARWWRRAADQLAASRGSRSPSATIPMASAASRFERPSMSLSETSRATRLVHQRSNDRTSWLTAGTTLAAAADTSAGQTPSGSASTDHSITAQKGSSAVAAMSATWRRRSFSSVPTARRSSSSLSRVKCVTTDVEAPSSLATLRIVTPPTPCEAMTRRVASRMSRSRLSPSTCRGMSAPSGCRSRATAIVYLQH